jgi:hypothetical protein
VPALRSHGCVRACDEGQLGAVTGGNTQIVAVLL